MGFDTWLAHDNFFEMNPPLVRDGGPPQIYPGESSEIVVREATRYIGKVKKQLDAANLDDRVLKRLVLPDPYSHARYRRHRPSRRASAHERDRVNVAAVIRLLPVHRAAVAVEALVGIASAATS